MADRLFGITDTGRVRENNEDLFITGEVMDGQFMLAGVIDGVGGYAGGEIAAALTKDIILNELSSVGDDVIKQLIRAFNLANEKIIAEKQEVAELAEMACVATLAVIDRANNQLHYIHVGDTRLYLYRDNSLIKISHDQSFVGFLEDSGRITEEAAMSHPKRNQINQALGLDNRAGMTDAYFETGSSPFLPGDVILICSDGLTDLVNKATISAVLNTPFALQLKGEELVAAANQAGGKDNITVVLARNDKARVAHDMSRPATAADGNLKSADLFEHPVQPVAADVIVDNHVSDIKPKNNSYLNILLLSFCLLFLGTTIWLFLTKEQNTKSISVPLPVQTHMLNAQEKMLRDTLFKLKGDTLILAANLFKGPVILSQPLLIGKDTLIIKTTGDLILQSDSAYKGPAFMLASSCKYIVLDKLIIEKFDTGIVSYPNALDLKNVRFNQVKNPVQLIFQFPEHSFVNGRLTRRVYQTDSLAKK